MIVLSLYAFTHVEIAQSLQSFIFLQYIIVILGLGVHWGENLFRKIHQVALFFGIFAGIGAIVLTGWEVNQCFFDLSSTNVHQANECIDKVNLFCYIFYHKKYSLFIFCSTTNKSTNLTHSSMGPTGLQTPAPASRPIPLHRLGVSAQT